MKKEFIDLDMVFLDEKVCHLTIALIFSVNFGPTSIGDHRLNTFKLMLREKRIYY
uniref:Uncharacterized protein n=1 Tax=Brassica oleracea TaxID=3712 RepID=A0A3P6G9T3_BRAOL|nr:unnamed protein product [Brassica oleracea]